MLPQQPEYMVPQIWASADVSLVTSRKGLSTDSVPSKTFAIMASGRPIIAMMDEGCEVWNLVQESQGGICVPPERPDLLADAILRLYNDENERRRMGKNGRRYVEKNFSRKIISEKYEELFLAAVT
jgi:colanic acid biosynthesis glycosyl transferase WcaI